MSLAKEPAKPAPTGPTSVDAIAQKFIADVQDLWNRLLYHETGGAWIAVVAALLLTVWTWATYGAAAGAPLAASTFVCLAMLV